MCENLKISFIDTTSLLSDSDMAGVGIHPNKHGAEKIEKQIITKAQLEEPQTNTVLDPATIVSDSNPTDTPHQKCKPSIGNQKHLPTHKEKHPSKPREEAQNISS